MFFQVNSDFVYGGVKFEKNSIFNIEWNLGEDTPDRYGAILYVWDEILSQFTWVSFFHADNVGSIGYYTKENFCNFLCESFEDFLPIYKKECVTFLDLNTLPAGKLYSTIFQKMVKECKEEIHNFVKSSNKLDNKFKLSVLEKSNFSKVPGLNYSTILDSEVKSELEKRAEKIRIRKEKRKKEANSLGNLFPDVFKTLKF